MQMANLFFFGGLDLALKNFQNGSNSNENNRLTKEESNEESKKEVTDVK